MPDEDDRKNDHKSDVADVGGSVHPFPDPRERVDRMGRRRNGAEEPVDLAAVQADDELLDALAAGLSVSSASRGGAYEVDEHVVALLSAWRDEVAAEPIPELIDIDTAVAAVRAGAKRAQHTRSGRSSSSGKGRHLAPVAAAAALLVLVGGGVTIGSASAQPGSALWPVSEVLYQERAVSLQAASRASTKIESAKQALSAGHPDVAAADLAQAQQDLNAVRPQDGQAQLTDVKNFLVAKAAETPSGTSVDPASPLRTDKSRPIPAGAALSQRPTATGTVSPTPSGVATTTAPSTTPSSGPPTTTKPSTTSAQPPRTTSANLPLTDSVGATALPGTTAPISGATSSEPTTVTSLSATPQTGTSTSG